MKKNSNIALGISLLLVAIFVYGMNYWEEIKSPALIVFLKGCVLLAALFIAQDRILKGIHQKLLDSNPALVAKKKELYLLYLQIGNSFPIMYKKVVKLFRYSTVVQLLSEAGLDPSDGENLEIAKCWLEKRSRIPIKGLSNKFKVKTTILGYERLSSRYESFFFDCLSGEIIRPAQHPAIIELVLVWVSYFYFLVELFEINLMQADYLVLVILFVFCSLAGVGARWIYHKKTLRLAIEACSLFYDYMDCIYNYTLRESCVYKKVEGEDIPAEMVIASTKRFLHKSS